MVNLNDEIGLIRELEYTRLIVDLNPIANIYTQIAG
ncbi:accessory Sec system glycosyltransferase Asp1, partial [Streptococcus pneumoniae]